MIYVTADTHFYHTAAINFPDRNFKSLKEMHERIITNWNLRVKSDDVIYVLGDYFLGTEPNLLTAITKKLHGKKFLILGNHDKFPMFVYTRAGFARVYDFPILFNSMMLFSHEPVLTLGDHGLINIHGHTHGQNFAQRTAKHYCACLECHNMFPVPITSIYTKLGFT